MAEDDEKQVFLYPGFDLGGKDEKVRVSLEIYWAGSDIYDRDDTISTTITHYFSVPAHHQTTPPAASLLDSKSIQATQLCLTTTMAAKNLSFCRRNL